MSEQIVFYGAGQEARNNLAKWKSAGIIPLCFVDADEHKHYTKFTDVNGDTEYDILPLNEAIKRYPNFVLYLTLGNDKLYSVTNYLMECGISKNAINYIELHDDMVAFDSSQYDLTDWLCTQPFHRMEFYSDGVVTPCCFGYLKNGFYLGNTNEQTLDEIWNSDNAKKLRYSVSKGNFQYCSKSCPSLISPENSPVMVRRESVELDYKTWEECSLIKKPSYINIACDFSCNLFCSSCRKKLVTPTVEEQLSVKSLLETFVRPSLDDCMHINFCGSGELFASKPIMEFLETLSQDKYPQLKLNILTNGTLFTPERWGKLANLKGMVDMVKVSIDAASKDTYESLRNGGNWETLCENIEYISSLRKLSEINIFQVNFVIQRNNYHEMRRFVELAKVWGADIVNFTRIRNWDTLSHEEFLEIDVFSPLHPFYEDASRKLAAIVSMEKSITICVQSTLGILTLH